MPFCTNCGQPYTQPPKFCTACGAAIAPVADMPPTRPVVQPFVPAQPAPATPVLVEKVTTGKRSVNYKLPLLLLLLAIAAFTAYKFFFAPNPKKDGTAAAQMECNCNEKHNAAWPSTYQAFITASANRSFTSNDEIVACVDSLASATERAFDSCSGEARNFYAASYKKYVGEKLNLFTEVYFKTQNECSSKAADFSRAFYSSRNDASGKLRNNIGKLNPQQAAETNDRINTPAPEESVKEETVVPPPPVEKSQSEMVQQLSRFFEAENSIASVGDIDNALDYYSYPMRRNFKLSNVTRERQHQIYKYQYVTKNLYHKLYDYQNHIKEIPLADGRTRLEVTFKFETSDNADGSNSRVQTVSNAYVFNADGKIESAGLATDKNL